MEEQFARTKKYYSTQEVAQLLGCHYLTLMKWRKLTNIQPVRFPGSNTRWYTAQDIVTLRELMQKPWMSGDVAKEEVSV